MKLYANLHLHSTHSDGVYTPTELARLAYEEVYKAAALTDHDAVTGNAEFMQACREFGMDSIFGIEFNAQTELYYRPDGRKGTFHITAFDFDPEYPEMKDYLEKSTDGGRTALRVVGETVVEFDNIKTYTVTEYAEKKLSETPEILAEQDEITLRDYKLDLLDTQKYLDKC